MPILEGPFGTVATKKPRQNRRGFLSCVEVKGLGRVPLVVEVVLSGAGGGFAFEREAIHCTD